MVEHPHIGGHQGQHVVGRDLLELFESSCVICGMMTAWIIGRSLAFWFFGVALRPALLFERSQQVSFECGLVPWRQSRLHLGRQRAATGAFRGVRPRVILKYLPGPKARHPQATLPA